MRLEDDMHAIEIEARRGSKRRGDLRRVMRRPRRLRLRL